MAKIIKELLKNEFKRIFAYLDGAYSNLLVPQEFTDTIIKQDSSNDAYNITPSRLKSANMTFKKTQKCLSIARIKLKSLEKEVTDYLFDN